MSRTTRTVRIVCNLALVALYVYLVGHVTRAAVIIPAMLALLLLVLCTYTPAVYHALRTLESHAWERAGREG
jgi:hypothetical protein